MDVHVSNVPLQCTSHALKNSLRHDFDKLSISIKNVNCNKHRNKPSATLTFLYVNDANLFLRNHGTVKSQDQKRSLPIGPVYRQLFFHSQKIYFKKSNRSASQFLLWTLAREEKERAQNERDESIPKPPNFLPVSFNISSFSCGTWCYEKNNLVFNAEQTWPSDGVAKFGRRSMILTLNSGLRIDFRYSATLSITICSENSLSIIFSMQEPARFFEMVSFEDLLSQLNLNPGQDKRANQTRVERNRLSCLSREHRNLASNCIVYRVKVKNFISIPRSLDDDTTKCLENLNKAREIPVIYHENISIRVGHPIYEKAFQTLLNNLSSLNRSFPFEVAFQVQKLAQNNYLPPSTVISLLPLVDGIFQRSGQEVTVATIRRFASEIIFPGVEAEASKFSLANLKSSLKFYESQIKRGGNLAELSPYKNFTNNVAVIHKVKVTPTGYFLYGPEQESNNRILRKYSENHNSFLRVQFCDEDGSQLHFGGRVSGYKILHEYFKSVMDNGITIAEKTFFFLGFSNSSLRMQSCWFVAPFLHNGKLLLEREIIQELGDFTLIKSPAKCAARIGQAFSDTRIAVYIDPSFVDPVEKDVERNGRVFSDGVGVISSSLLDIVCDHLPQKWMAQPTCLQIRYQGGKGMISLDKRLRGNRLTLRESMVKFKGSSSNDLEICDAAYKPLPAYLNRQLIKIMEDLGVKESFFINLQAQEVARLRKITESATNASVFLKKQNIGDTINLPWLVSKLTSIGCDFRRDGFLRDVLELAILSELRLLKYKTRIPVPKAWHLHGIMDESGFLEEGQIFCAALVEGEYQLVIGKNIIISRAPALHPGDVQLVDAVEPPVGSPLLYLYNCICFSSKGQRDLPSQLSGGDLDGDRYYIIWDENARLSRPPFKPADYPRLSPVDIGRAVTQSDMTDHFLQFMETDQLGRIAVLHRVLADQSDQGTLYPDCMILAEMHSTAVDFSKTGIPVDLSRMPRCGPWRPDFEAPGPYVVLEERPLLEKSLYIDPSDQQEEDDDIPSYRYYESQHVLGKLYRAIDEREIFEGIQRRSTREGVNSRSTVINAAWAYVQHNCPVIQWKHKINWARDIKEMYENIVINAMHDYSEHPKRAISELEVFAGTVLGRSGAPTKIQRELTTSLKEKFEEDSRFIVNCIRMDGHEWSPEALERSMACLYVSLDNFPTVKRSSGSSISFKYLAAAVCLKEVERVVDM